MPLEVDPRKVFVVHGRNEGLRRDMFAFLQSIGLHPLEWSELVSSTGVGAPYVGEVLDAAFEQAQAIVVLMTPDDEARLLPPFQHPDDPAHELALTPQARPNVLFEAGMAFGKRPEKVILVEIGRLRPFSDIGGRHTIKFDGAQERRRDVVQRLRIAGCAVNDSGAEWLTEGEFRLERASASPATPLGEGPWAEQVESDAAVLRSLKPLLDELEHQWDLLGGGPGPIAGAVGDPPLAFGQAATDFETRYYQSVLLDPQTEQLVTEIYDCLRTFAAETGIWKMWRDIPGPEATQEIHEHQEARKKLTGEFRKLYASLNRRIAEYVGMHRLER